MKKFVTMALALLSALGLLVGCGGTPASVPDTSSKPAAPQTSESPSGGDEVVTLTFLRNGTWLEYPADGGRAKPLILEAAAKAGISGIDYQVEVVSGEDYYTKLNLLAASKDLPDYFNVDITTMTRFADEGLIRPLDDLLADYGPHIQKLVMPAELDALTYNDGLMALPIGYLPEAFNGPNTNGFVYRYDWLKKLGLNVPETLDDLHDVLKAFTFDDPDGNGKNDTYGFAASKDGQFLGIFGAFGIAPDFWHVAADGRLKQGSVLPEAKDALAVLRQWYEEGLIDPEFPIMERKKLDEKVVNSQVGVYQYNAFQTMKTEINITSLREVVPEAELRILTPPKGPSGKQGWPETEPGYTDKRSMSVNCKNPELLMRFVDWAASYDEGGGGMLCNFGIEGDTYTYDAENDVIIQNVKTLSDLYAQGFSNPARFFTVTDRRYIEEEHVREAMNITNTYVIPNEFWKTVPAMFDYPDLKKVWMEYFTKIVTGELPLDSWETYVQEYYKQGGQVIEDQVNEAWTKAS